MDGDAAGETGVRFSLFYQERGELGQDSKKMRMRLSRLLYQACRDLSEWYIYTVARLVASELGVAEILLPMNVHNWDNFFDQAELATVLDMPSLVFKMMDDKGHFLHCAKKSDEINRIFIETRVSYVCDELGGVRYAVDKAFEACRSSAIEVLSDPRYSSARSHIEAMDAAALQGDFRQAVRSVFDAAENIFKQMSSKDRLTHKFAQAELPKAIGQAYRTDDVAKRSANQVTNSFCNWVDAAHHYRHEAGKPDPHHPPKDFALVLLSQGISFVRWLATLHIARTESG